MATVFQKLNLKDQTEIVILNAPASFEPEIQTLRGTAVRRSLGNAGHSFSLAFVTKQAEVDALARTIGERVDGDAVVWFAYPKKSSKKYTCEIDRDHGWQELGKAGFEPVRMVAIDEDWSAVRFRRVGFIKQMQRDPSYALTKAGRAKAATGTAASRRAARGGPKNRSAGGGK
jgi:hypothetical protein